MQAVPHIISGALLHGLFADEFCGRGNIGIATEFIRHPQDGVLIHAKHIAQRLTAVLADTRTTRERYFLSFKTAGLHLWKTS